MNNFDTNNSGSSQAEQTALLAEYMRIVEENLELKNENKALKEENARLKAIDKLPPTDLAELGNEVVHGIMIELFPKFLRRSKSNAKAKMLDTRSKRDIWSDRIQKSASFVFFAGGAATLVGGALLPTLLIAGMGAYLHPNLRKGITSISKNLLKGLARKSKVKAIVQDLQPEESESDKVKKQLQENVKVAEDGTINIEGFVPEEITEEIVLEVGDNYIHIKPVEETTNAEEIEPEKTEVREVLFAKDEPVVEEVVAEVVEITEPVVEKVVQDPVAETPTASPEPKVRIIPKNNNISPRPQRRTPEIPT